MTISYNWLKKYIETNVSVGEISSILTAIGLEVDALEKVETIKGGLEGVLVGKVLSCEKHPDADKLSVTTVDVGEGEPVQIVCGAPNVAMGQTVLVATIGCTLYPTGAEEGFKIKRSKIRGVESLGMICAEDELGIGTSHEGIMVVPDVIAAGTPAREYLNIEDDYIIEIGLTPNRIDAASHYGVARDLAAYLSVNDKPVKLTRPAADKLAIDNNSNVTQIKVENTEACPRYTGITVSNVKVAPSPDWLQNNLRSIGINPKNNIVDITNYILHAYGQPMHAFDADKIAGKTVVVKTCPEGTPFTTLDGVERKLTAKDLMICDAEKPMCIAGVFGGIGSGVTEETINVFLESAYFNPTWVRKSAKYHGLNTDASFRYERGADPDITTYALIRAATLIKEIAGGEITSDIIDIYPNPIKPFKVELSLDYANKLIGKEIPKETVTKILKALEIKITKDSGDQLSLEVPSYRVDVYREADVIEEILRIYGYNNVEIGHKVNSSLSYAPFPDKDKITNSVSDFLTSNGFNEIMSNSLTKAAYYDNNETYKAENCVKILNPLSVDLNVMRQTLLYNALEAAQSNSNRRISDLKLYEFGNVYFYSPSKKEEGGLAPYSENRHLSMLVTGSENTASWNIKANQSSFFTLKGYVEKVLKRFGLDINDAKTEPFSSNLYSEAVGYSLRGKRIFEMGVISKNLRNSFDLKNEAYYMEMNFDSFVNIIKNNSVTAKDLPKYPEVKRDLALLVDKSVTFAQLRQIAFATEKKLLKSVSLFDVYEGDKLPEGKKSYALNFVLQDTERTMKDEDIDNIMSKLQQKFEQQAGAQIR